MTSLEKKIARRTRAPFKHYRRRIVVTLEPGDVLGMRLERTRKTVTAPLSAIYIVLNQWEADRVRREKKARKKAKQ